MTKLEQQPVLSKGLEAKIFNTQIKQSLITVLTPNTPEKIQQIYKSLSPETKYKFGPHLLLQYIIPTVMEKQQDLDQTKKEIEKLANSPETLKATIASRIEAVLKLAQTSKEQHYFSPEKEPITKAA